eukprot:1689523-Rhodomonas_salina.1
MEEGMEEGREGGRGRGRGRDQRHGALHSWQPHAEAACTLLPAPHSTIRQLSTAHCLLPRTA